MTPGRTRPALVTDLTGATHRPLILSERFVAEARRRQLAQRPPADQRERLDLTRKIEGIPLDVLFLLDALTLLAEQGNDIAKSIVYRERRRLGIDLRTYG